MLYTLNRIQGTDYCYADLNRMYYHNNEQPNQWLLIILDIWVNFYVIAKLYVPKGTVDKYKSTDYWSKFVFIEESDPTDIIQVLSDDLLISAQNGTITVRGEQNGLPLTVYSADGKMLGSATMKDGQASISTNLQRGEIAIVKVGSKSVKIKM